MLTALRPMNLGEILDRTFEIYRKQLLLFVGLAALPAAVMLTLHLADDAWLHTHRWIRSAGKDEAGRIALGFLLGYGYYHIAGFVGLLFQAAFVRAVSREIFGESNSVLGSVRFAAARWRTYLWIAILRHSAQLLVPEALAIGLFVGAFFIFDKLKMTDDFFPLGAVFILLVAALFAAFFFVGISLAFAIPAAAFEQMAGWKSLYRSWHLTKDNRGRILVAFIMVFVCALVLDGVVALLAWWIATLIYTAHRAAYNEQVYRVIVQFLYTLVAIVVAPLYPIALTLLYYDQRSRKEGYDIERMMEAAGLTALTAHVANQEEPSPIGTGT